MFNHKFSLRSLIPLTFGWTIWKRHNYSLIVPREYVFTLDHHLKHERVKYKLSDGLVILIVLVLLAILVISFFSLLSFFSNPKWQLNNAFQKKKTERKSSTYQNIMSNCFDIVIFESTFWFCIDYWVWN